MPKRLAITISGAVSLGSFEAGVLYEIISAIGQHNQDANTLPQNRIYIDVLTGASAGGMTATIAAQKLLYEKSALDGAYTNAFYRPWVADVSINGLLALNQSEDPAKSIFSSDFVSNISRRYLTARYQTHADVPRNPHPAINTEPGAPVKNQKLHLGLALSNLNGVDYGLPIKPAGRFIYTRHQDELTTGFDIQNLAEEDNLDTWEPLRNAAVSCGAFAFAFRPVDVKRHDFEYKSPNLVSIIHPVENFTYTDGGTFQNEPLGMAKLLVDQIDEHLDVENRFFLFVSPGTKDSTATSERIFNEGTADFKKTAEQLVGAIFAQARFQDWITAEEINQQIALFNQRAVELLALLLKDKKLANSLKTSAETILPLLIPDAKELKQAQARLKKQFAREYDPLAAPVNDIWIDAILALEKAADLGDNDEMTIYGVAANDSELASSGLCAFAGFFDRSYRDHDYDVGRTKAQAFLKNTLFGLPFPIQYTTEPIRRLTPGLAGIPLAKMDPGIRTNVRDRLRDRLKESMSEAGMNFLEREAVDLAIIKPHLNTLLEL